jgi:thiamine pyrophosphokinase
MPAEGGRRVSRVVIILAGGDPVDARVRDRLPSDAYVIAADSGLHLAAALGVHVDRVVGDFDSADPATVGAAEAAGAAIERHPAAKDATDLELAFDAALEHGAGLVVVAGGAGGRLDHFLANVALLASPRLAAVDIEMLTNDGRVRVLRGGRGPVALGGVPGDLLSLIPVGGPALGITTTGLEYPLHGEALPLGTSRGVSNVIVETTATVELADGALLVVQPFGGLS